MAYFGGNVSSRPWPRVDIRFLMLLLLSVAGVVLAIVIARDSILSQIQQAQNSQTKPAEQMNIAAPENNGAVQQASKMEVLVAADDIAAGSRLRPAMFKLETRDANSDLSTRAMLNLNEIEGAYARVSIGQGVPLLKDSVSSIDENQNSNIIERIPPGYRAVAIPVNIVTGVEGWVQPGARVDVVWTTENKGKLIATTLIENAQVLSAARKLENLNAVENTVEPVPSHVTLLVSTADSQKLQLAKNSGSLSLSLRGDLDVDPGNAATLTTDSIIKNTNQRRPLDYQGKVSFGGTEYVLSGSNLIPQSQFEARARMKDPKN